MEFYVLKFEDPCSGGVERLIPTMSALGMTDGHRYSLIPCVESLDASSVNERVITLGLMYYQGELDETVRWD